MFTVRAPAAITAANYFVILAFRHSAAIAVSPFRYTALLWSTLAGYLIWRMTPDAWAFAGAALIVAGGLYFVHREWTDHRRRKRAALEPALLES